MSSVLIIDDDIVVRERLQIQMESSGYYVETAEDGESALEIVRQLPVQLVILDVMMPRKGGLETLVEIAQIQEPRPKVILITGLDRVDTPVFQNIADKFGVRHIFQKPVDMNSLLAAARELLD